MKNRLKEDFEEEKRKKKAKNLDVAWWARWNVCARFHRRPEFLWPSHDAISHFDTKTLLPHARGVFKWDYDKKKFGWTSTWKRPPSNEMGQTRTHRHLKKKKKKTTRQEKENKNKTAPDKEPKEDDEEEEGVIVYRCRDLIRFPRQSNTDVLVSMKTERPTQGGRLSRSRCNIISKKVPCKRAGRRYMCFSSKGESRKEL